MSVELRVPEVGESITEVQIGDWLKSEGERVAADEPLVVIETDKVTVELPAPSAGVIGKLLKRKGDSAEVGEVIGYLEDGEGAATGAEGAATSTVRQHEGGGEEEQQDAGDAPEQAQEQPKERGAAAPAARTGAGRKQREQEQPQPAAQPERERDGGEPRVMPAARRLLEERGLAPQDVRGTGPGGRITKQDVKQAPARKEKTKEQEQEQEKAAPAPASRASTERKAPAAPAGERQEEVVPMTPMRKRIAERLVQAQQTAAILTTFNEIDMTAAAALRKEHQERFQERYGIKLGFMSFFVKAAIEALKLVPQVNAEVRDGSVVYKNYYDIGVAVGGGKGLVVPVIRSAELLSFAEVELAIADLGARARDNKLALEELQGGTFTISNGGIYGSLLSTPILNPPQSGILGLHAIQDRPVARDGQVVVRPMMYVALSYDHRIVDGREAVTFLKRIKECVEAPARILLEV